MSDTLNLHLALLEAERECLLQALAETHGILEDACALMGVSLRTGYRLIAKHGLHLRRMVVASLPPNHAPLDTSLAPEETPDAPL